jgi:hypothetical protein
MSFEKDFLAHYGKKGMRWGQRSGPNLRTTQGLTYKQYKQDPNFKMDTRYGIEGQVAVARGPKGSNVLASTGKYRSAADKKAVGTDYANAVLKAQGRRKLAAMGIGGLVGVGAYAGGRALA